MEYTSIDIVKKLKIKDQNIKYFRNSIPLIEGIDFYYIQVGDRKLYKYTKKGFLKLKNRKELKK